jgi:hypothetical protein
MPTGWKIISGTAILALAAFLSGGRYTVTQQGTVAFVVDRFTGSVRYCRQDGCRTVPTDLSSSAEEDPTGGFVRQSDPAPKKTGFFDDILPEKRQEK